MTNFVVIELTVMDKYEIKKWLLLCFRTAIKVLPFKRHIVEIEISHQQTTLEIENNQR